VSILFNILTVVDVALQFVLLFFLLRGPFRRYVFLFVYSITFLITTLTEFVLIHSHRPVLYRRVYWTDEIATDLLLFLVVISLIYLASEGSAVRPKMSKILMAIVAIVLVIPFVILNPPSFFAATGWTSAWGRWFNGTSQVLNFGAAIMNLGLWSVLLTSRKRDPQLLKVSIGVGVAVAGQAIGFGLRRFLPDTAVRQIPDLFMSLTHVLSVLLWCWAFKTAARRPDAPKVLDHP
jgi:hypothetical protein